MSQEASDNKKPTQETFFEFPCQFPIKVMMNPEKEAVERIISIMEKHIENADKIEFKTRESKNAKFISLTAIFTAQSKDQLDALYTDISADPDVHMVL